MIGSSRQVDDPARISIRLIQVLRTYCHGLHARPLADLRGSLSRGRYPWFREELTAAIRFSAFTAADWQAAVGPPRQVRASREAGVVRQQQRIIWSALFPGDRFPSRARKPRT